MPTFSRRAFLALAALLSPVAELRAALRQARPSAVSQAISLDEFLRLSQRLVGRTTLDRRVAATYLTALVAVPSNAVLLAQLAAAAASRADLTPAHTALERTIVEWWYTGVYSVNGERRLATHTGALMWSALGMPAPGTCVGAMGAWSRPPRAASL